MGLGNLFGGESKKESVTRKLLVDFRNFRKDWKNAETAREESLLELKKKQEELAKKVGPAVGEMKESLDKASGELKESLGKASGELLEKTEDLTKKTEKLTGKVSIHDMALENLLEEWEDIRGQEKEKLAKLDSFLEALDTKKYGEILEEQEKLLALVLAYQEQLAALHRLVEGEEQWTRQLDLMEEKLSPGKKRAQVEFVGKAGEQVDLSLHEVWSVTDTPEAGKDGRILEVYSPGCVYAGKVWKKARVNAFRYVPE